jgi:4-amino-4-deoxy-L-arabinose transferase-like glycosyltransferase
VSIISKLKFKNTHLLSLIVIFLLAFFLRTVALTQIPSGFHADEASFYINALAISKTGADEDGNKLPLSLASIIDPKPAFYSYIQIPSLIIFDNQVFASRFPSVVLSIFSLFIGYLLVRKLSNKKIALLTTLILAISPWHIMVSRGTQEVIASFLFLLVSLLLLISYLEKKKINQIPLLLSFLFTSFLSMYFYHSAKLLLPLLAFGLIVYFYLCFKRYKKSSIYIKSSVIILAILVFAGISSLLIQESNSRISAVGIFHDQAPKQELMEQIFSIQKQLPNKVVSIFHNKIQIYSTAILKEYASYFSPEFLFLLGGKPTRYVVPDHGLLYMIEIPLLLIGLYTAIKSKKKEAALFIGIILLSPIPSSLTTEETPSIIRSFPMIIGLAYFVAYGIQHLVETKKPIVKKLIIISLLSLYVWQILFFTIQYQFRSKFVQPWFRNSPYTDIAKEVKKIEGSYKEVRVANNLRPLYTYFVIEELISIEELQSHPHIRDNDRYTLGKFSFNEFCGFEKIEPNVLYIAETECYLKNPMLSNMKVVKSITYKDGKKVYELLQVAQ